MPAVSRTEPGVLLGPASRPRKLFELDPADQVFPADCFEQGRTAVRAGQQLTRLAPLRESGYRYLMRALAAQDNLAEALGVYGRLRECLRDVFTGCEQFFRPGYTVNLVPSWIPALNGVEDKLRAGGKVADIGCGLGASTILLAQEYPNSVFTGSDYHDQSIAIARKRAAIRQVAAEAGFTRFRRAAQTPFNLVYEARP